jgi:23S rRNA (cytidine1920-2'-O)/16S rRNA (cytidine1409-2'-O)-methyltransferase
MAGRVLVDGRVCDKPGELISREAAVTLLEPENPFVSRGGLKLEGALRDLSIAVEGLVILDVGASTGGFTDCLLQKGARRVYALDVGYGQLAWRLRNHPQVVVMERFNIRLLERRDLPETPAMAVVDVSFISLKLVLPVLCAVGINAVLALVKPQFEAGRNKAARGRGVIRDPAVHRAVLLDLISFACRNGYCCAGLAFSRRPGPRGNIEFFLYLTRPGGACCCPVPIEAAVAAVVERSHRELT